jgi:hypothetical protein
MHRGLQDFRIAGRGDGDQVDFRSMEKRKFGAGFLGQTSKVGFEISCHSFDLFLTLLRKNSPFGISARPSDHKMTFYLFCEKYFC